MVEGIYSRKSYDNLYHVKNFMLAYKSLVNVPRLKSDKDGYTRYINSLTASVKGINFENTSMFVCEKDISKDLFLVGFSTLSDIKTYYYCNMIQLFDIWWGNCKPVNTGIDEDDIIFSEQNINQDVLCLYIDRDMYSNKQDKVVNSVIVSRQNKVNHKGLPLLTWVFFRGNSKDLDGQNFCNIKQLFTSRQEDGFKIHVISPGSLAVSSGKGGKGNVGGSVGSGSTTLESMY